MISLLALIKTYVVGTQKNRLIETILLSTHNIGFGGQMSMKNTPYLELCSFCTFLIVHIVKIICHKTHDSVHWTKIKFANMLLSWMFADWFAKREWEIHTHTHKHMNGWTDGQTHRGTTVMLYSLHNTLIVRD